MVDFSADATLVLTPLTSMAEASLLISLLEEIVRGHTQSLSRLHHLTAKRLFCKAHYLSRSRMDAEEIVCDTFLYAWQNAHRYDPARGSVMAWLTIIVRHRSIDLIRKRRNRGPFDNDDFRVADLECGARSPDEVVTQLEAGNLVQRLLTELPILRRRLVELAFFEHLTHQEISVVMGLPAGTVKSHIRRALGKMGTLVNSYEPAPECNLIG